MCGLVCWCVGGVCHDGPTICGLVGLVVLMVLVGLVGLVCWWCVVWGIAPCGLVCGCWCVGVHVYVCCMWADAPMVVLVVLVVVGCSLKGPHPCVVWCGGVLVVCVMMAPPLCGWWC